MSTPKYDPFEYIRNYYGVPARKEQRVEFENQGVRRQGRICGCHNQYIKIHFDGESKSHNGVFHPTDSMTYL